MGLYSKYIFPRLLDWSLRADEFRRLRSDTLATAYGEVLEIGFGTGLNLYHYPQGVSRLTTIDSERMLADRVARRVTRVAFPVEQMQLDASGRLPFEDDTFDTVVSTWTLCSIGDLPAALAEVRRVMKPEGHFIFLEHGRSDDQKVARWQDRLNPFQKVIGVGCNMNRRIDQFISEVGMNIIRLDRFQLRDAPRMLGEMYRGTAKK
ncbi:MAG TPA: class I SAM-dependent methyltransferase [Blastocatellia bacterium]|jgi:ubiquinone/menaquinone biosynthesis C-methylase UbiE